MSEENFKSPRASLNCMTLGEIKARQNNMNSHKYHPIRSHARNKYKNELKDGCEICGYSKHTEVAHIKEINSFNDNATVEEINDKDNVLILCPNCHWEFDHGLLMI
jgi:predicted restriction endonuclease